MILLCLNFSRDDHQNLSTERTQEVTQLPAHEHSKAGDAKDQSLILVYRSPISCRYVRHCELAEMRYYSFINDLTGAPIAY